jgi:hypothetical protein
MVQYHDFLPNIGAETMHWEFKVIIGNAESSFSCAKRVETLALIASGS